MAAGDTIGVLHRIGSRPIDELKKIERFIPILVEHLDEVISVYSLSATIDEARLREAYYYWLEDLDRVGNREFGKNHDAPDHFKHAAHLAYWLRRSKPIIDLQIGVTIGSPDLSLEDAYKDEYELFFKFINEYFAFDVGFHIVMFYERNKTGSKSSILDYLIGEWDYYQCVCYFLNSKNVSPHALFLIYKSLFQGK